MEIIVRKYEHFNRSFKHWDTPKGKYIRTKRQYNEAMAREGMVPYEEAKERVEKFDDKLNKSTYGPLSRKADSLIRSVHGGKKGKIALSDRQIDAMKEVGVNFNALHCPKHYQKEGGFDATD